MKKILTLIFIGITTLSLTTGCESKDLTSYIEESELSDGRKIGYIKMDKQNFKELATEEEFQNLMYYVKEEKYDYFIVAFSKNKGLYCLYPNCIYENISKDIDGNYIPTAKIYGRIQKDGDGNYKYEKYED